MSIFDKTDKKFQEFLTVANENLDPFNYDGNRYEGLESFGIGAEGDDPLTKLGSEIVVGMLSTVGTMIVLPVLMNLFSKFSDYKSTIDETIITIPVVVTDDIPKSIRDDYCGCLEILYGMIIKSTVDGRSRLGNGDVRRIMKDLPFLSPNEKVKVSGTIAVLSDVTGRVIKEKEGEVKTTGGTAVDVFLESIKEYYNEDLSSNFHVGTEGDEVIVKTGRTGLPTFINVESYVRNGTKMEKKSMQIGIRCVAKTITKEDAISFFVKHNNSITDVKTATSLWQKVKNVVSLSFLRSKNSANPDSPTTVKTLEAMLNAVKSVNKPFVAMLLSDEVRETLLENNLNIANPGFVKSLYAKYPLLSISFFDSNSDTFLVSLLKDSVFARRSVSELNSERDKYERVIGDMVRANRLLQ